MKFLSKSVAFLFLGTAFFGCKVTETETEYVEVEKEVTVEVDKKADETAPADVTNLAAVNKGGAVLLTWTDATDADIYGYEVTYSASTAARVVLTPLAQNAIMASQGAGGAYVHDLTNGTEYTFTVRSVDTSGNKSAGITVSATPEAIDASDTLKIALSVPTDDDGTPILSNTSVTVTAKITSASTVTRVVYKKNGSINAASLLADSGATEATATDDNTVWTFSADERTTYTVAAIDAAGREETAQIAVQTIDKTPPAEVTNVNTQYSKTHNSVEITWTDPAESTADYDSPFDHVLITYSIDGGDEQTLQDTVAKGEKAASITVSDDSVEMYAITVHTVDALGNISAGALTRCYISNAVNATASDVVTKIGQMTQSGTVKVTGAITTTLLTNIKTAINKLDDGILVKLDLGEATGVTSLKSASYYNDGQFYNCTKLSGIVLPNVLKTIPTYAFYGCTSLASVTIPDGVTSIGNY